MKTLNDYKIKLSIAEIVYDDTKREVEILEEKMANLKRRLIPLKNELSVYSTDIRDLQNIISKAECRLYQTYPYMMGADNED